MNDWLTAAAPLIIGHRGASAAAPENSLAAFGLALEQGAAGVELDLHLSADGHLVIIHDHDVSRTTNGSGLVAEMSLAQLKELDAGQGETILTLDELWQALGSRLLYNVEIKDFGAEDRGAEAALARLIARHGLGRRVLVSSFNPAALTRARHYLPPDAPLALLRYGAFDPAPPLPGCRADHPHHELVDEAYLAWAKERGVRVHAWTVDDPAEAQRLVNLGVHGIITNDPAALIAGLTS